MLPRSLAPSLPRFLVVVVAGSLLTLALPRSAHAACGWDAELTAVTHDPRSSAAFTVSWATDDFKVYAKAWDAGTLTTFYVTDLSSSPTVEDCPDCKPSPTFQFDDIYKTPLDTDCMANVDVFTYLDGSTPREGMFFDAGSAANYDGAAMTCINGVNTPAVYFAELVN